MAPQKRLFVLRHAKSSWDDPGLDDHERPLAPRGQRATRLIAAYMRDGDITPALVLCSSARRTLETLAAVAPGGETVVEPGLYAANAAAVIERLRQVPGSTPSVMVIGHNPALQMLVSRLASRGESASSDGALTAVQGKFPTGALATLSFVGEWRDLRPGCAKLTALVRPRDLE